MSTKRGIEYIPAIDGLRAIAVIAVMLYHLGVSWIPGGFLGVDLFFVISGYVITRLLLDSIQQRGGLDLRDFYFARIRRLLPPLVFMIVATSIFVGLWAPDTTKKFLTDTPFSLTGSQSLTLTTQSNAYTGSTIVNQGTLNLISGTTTGNITRSAQARAGRAPGPPPPGSARRPRVHGHADPGRNVPPADLERGPGEDWNRCHDGDLSGDRKTVRVFDTVEPERTSNVAGTLVAVRDSGGTVTNTRTAWIWFGATTMRMASLCACSARTHARPVASPLSLRSTTA